MASPLERRILAELKFGFARGTHCQYCRLDLHAIDSRDRHEVRCETMTYDHCHDNDGNCTYIRTAAQRGTR